MSIYVKLSESGSFSLDLKEKKRGGVRVEGKGNVNAHHSKYKITSFAQIKDPETEKVFSIQTP